MLSDGYLKKLVNAMRQAFLNDEHVTSKVVSRLYRDVYRDTDQVPLQISRAARQALLDGRLTTCGVCGTVGELDPREFRPGGLLYEEATNIDRRLVDGKVYELSNCLFVKYSSISDCLTVLDDRCHPKCLKCGSLTSIMTPKRMMLNEKRSGQPRSSGQPGTSGTSRVLHTEQSRRHRKTPPKLEKNEKPAPKASTSGSMRVKVRLSDGQTDIMELVQGTTVSSFLSSLSQKFGISHDQIHSIRSGHPPKVLDRNRPQANVEFMSGDRVEVVLGHPPRVEPESNKRENDIISPILKLGKYAKKSTEAKEFVPKKYPSDIPPDVQQLWHDADRHETSLWNRIVEGLDDGRYGPCFSRGGGYYQLTCKQKNLDDLVIGEHYQLMRLNDMVFYWSGENFQLCTGPNCHKNVTDIHLYTVTTNDFKHNCINLNRLRQATESGPGINRLGGVRAPIRDVSDELRKVLSSKR